MINKLIISSTLIINILMLWMIFWWLPIDISQGPVAKTIFIHVPLAWCGLSALITGIVWAKPIWGVWWTGEAKLTTTLILILIYCAYILFRSLYTNNEQMKNIAAIIAVLGAIDTPLIYFAANLWQEAHPVTVIGPLSEEGTSFGMYYGITLLISVIAFTFTFLILTTTRYKTIKIETHINNKE
jgi:heme exporter protein C